METGQVPEASPPQLVHRSFSSSLMEGRKTRTTLQTKSMRETRLLNLKGRPLRPAAGPGNAHGELSEEEVNRLSPACKSN